MPITPAELQSLLPSISAWAHGEETNIMRKGQHLSLVGLDIARILGVVSPSQVRIMLVDQIPAPPAEFATKLAEVGMLAKDAGGMTFGHGIYIRRDNSSNSELLAHELVHVCQFERLGFEGFLFQYGSELIQFGYARAPLELEAIQSSKQFCQS